MSFLRKALSPFVEFGEDEVKQDTVQPLNNTSPSFTQQTQQAPVFMTPTISQSEIEKFEKYFDNMFEKANLPGPDYFEFYKMMETLEPHIHDEKARISATFVSLSIQGLTKEQLIGAANKYLEILTKDEANFNSALSEKLKLEVGKRQSDQDALQKRIEDNSELVQKLTKDISDAQIQISKLKSEIAESENKLNASSSGYKLASQAMLNKITTDIQKIKETI
jgi:predicted  nucleic acid-binding Zn-ribbon protein